MGTEGLIVPGFVPFSTLDSSQVSMVLGQESPEPLPSALPGGKAEMEKEAGTQTFHAPWMRQHLSTQDHAGGPAG